MLFKSLFFPIFCWVFFQLLRVSIEILQFSNCLYLLSILSGLALLPFLVLLVGTYKFIVFLIFSHFLSNKISYFKSFSQILMQPLSSLMVTVCVVYPSPSFISKLYVSLNLYVCLIDHIHVDIVFISNLTIFVFLLRCLDLPHLI